MTAKPKRDAPSTGAYYPNLMPVKSRQSRYRGRFLPGWAGDFDKRLSKVEGYLYGENDKQGLLDNFEDYSNYFKDLRERLGTSTPLIIWNIAVLVWVAGLTIAVMRLYGYAP